jgi:hypothetical protein
MSMPLAHPDLPSGDLDPVQFVSLIKDVSALRSAIAISRAHEDSLVSRVEALETLVTTLWDSYLETLAPTSMRTKPTAQDEEDNEEEEDLFIIAESPINQGVASLTATRSVWPEGQILVNPLPLRPKTGALSLAIGCPRGAA